MAADGRFVVVWARYNSLYGRLYDTQGGALGAPLALAASAGEGPAVAMHADGSFVTVADEDIGNGKRAVFARGFDASGQPDFPRTAVSAEVGSTYTHGLPAIGMHANGDFQVAWQEMNGSTADVYLRRFGANGLALGDAIRANSAPAQPYCVGFDVDSLGAATVAWNEGGRTVMARSFDRAGSFDGDPYEIFAGAPGDQVCTFPRSVAFDADGRFLVAWSRQGSESSVFGRFYEAPSAKPTSDAVVAPVGNNTVGGASALESLMMFLAAAALRRTMPSKFRHRSTGAARTSGSPARC